MRDVFTLDTMNEIRLSKGPLRQVISQVQYSQTPYLTSADAAQAIAQQLPEYPVMRQAPGFNVSIGPNGVEQAQTSLRTFSDVPGNWTVTLGETSVAVETTAYVSRDDFCYRVHKILAAVEKVAAPPIVDRLGLRYINRIEGNDQLADIGALVNDRLLVMSGSVGSGMSLQHSISDSLITIGSADQMQVRTGLLPPGGAFSPGVATSEVTSWVLDVDVFSAHGGFLYTADELERRLRRYSDHAYSYFRWATTEEMHRRYGAEG